VGAHTVGVADGGPGLPLLGWSTVAGDLRIPHFVGMHALQVLPLAALLLEALARRMPALARPLVRRGILRVLVGFYLGVLALVTGQALAGQSIVQPNALVIAIAAALFAAAAATIAVTLRRESGGVPG
jgi:nitrate reductase gamma subunit